MNFALRRFGAAGMLGASLLLGCQSAEPCATTVATSAECTGGQNCNGCPSCDANLEEDDSRLWSDEWYRKRAHLPVGARQVESHGKVWPPFPRPTEPQQPLAHQFHAAHYWPHPYNCQDRQSVNDFTQIHIHNGWALQTTLYHYHFEEETVALNHAGLVHLQYILENAPEQYRVCWVQTGPNQLVSQNRVDAVRQAAAEMVGPENVPPVMLRVGSPGGVPAQQIDMQFRGWMETQPKPRLQYTPLETQQN